MKTNTLGRREFIKDLTLLAGTSLLATAPWIEILSDTGNTRNEKARLGIIGCGSRGKYLIQHLLQNKKAEIVAICDDLDLHLQETGVLVPSARAYSDYRALLEDKTIDGVVIATPPAHHASMTIASYEAGKHVFVEKALSIHMEEALAIYQAHKAGGKVLFVGQQRFFDPRYIQCMAMIHSGEFGSIQSIRMNWDRNTDWRRPVPEPGLERKINWRLYNEYSRGLMTELACHQLQVGMWAMKSIPCKVMGIGSRLSRKHEREGYDNVSCLYSFENGVKMTYESTNSNKFYGLEERILCERATFEPERGKYYAEELPPASGLMQMISQAENSLFDAIPLAGSSWIPETGYAGQGKYILGSKPDGDGTRQLLEAYVESVITGLQPANFAEEAYYGTQLCLLGHRAMDEERPLAFPEEFKIDYLNHKNVLL
ncbi:MAG: Gfo/Idh/MocA family oxidoreductase [Bacteroidales bacterium]